MKPLNDSHLRQKLFELSDSYFTETEPFRKYLMNKLSPYAYNRHTFSKTNPIRIV